MPNRLVREAILTSESLDKLSAEAERLFYRLLVVCDDFGRFEADVRVMIARCFPLRVGDITREQMHAWVHELTKAGVIHCYEHDAKRYGSFLNWKKFNKLRAKNSKYPAPADTCEHMSADESTCEHMRVYTDSDSDSDSETPVVPKGTFDVARAWSEFCAIYPKRSGSLNKQAAESKFRKLCKSAEMAGVILEGVKRYARWCDATGKTKTELVAQMTTWLNGRRWDEEYTVPGDDPPLRVVPGHVDEAEELREYQEMAR